MWFGAALTGFLFVLGKFGLGLYIGKAAVGPSYGAAQPTAPLPAYTKAPAKSGGGGKKLAIGGILGLLMGALLGGVTAFVVAIKSIKKLVTAPLKLLR